MKTREVGHSSGRPILATSPVQAMWSGAWPRDVGDEGREELHVVHVAAAAAPVHPAGEALAQKIAQRRPGQRALHAGR